MLRPSVPQFDLRPHRRQQLARGLDVAHLRNVFENDRLFREQRRGHRRQRGILGAADANRPQQRIPAANYKFIHDYQTMILEPIVILTGLLGLRQRARSPFVHDLGTIAKLFWRPAS